MRQRIARGASTRAIFSHVTGDYFAPAVLAMTEFTTVWLAPAGFTMVGIA